MPTNQRDLVFNLIANTSRFSGPMQGAVGPLRSLGELAGAGAGKLKVFGAAAGVAGVAAIGLGAAVISSSVKAFADFDAAMTESLAIMGDVSETMRGDMSDAAREVAKTTTFSADQAAGSFFYLASAGLDAAQSIEALPKVAAFAQAGAFDMATATDLLTDAQSALGLSVEDTTKNMQNMTRVSDVLVRANTLANATVQQFSEALTNKAGAALRVLNKDVEEGAAVLAVYADQGLKGAAAGEALNIVMRDLQKASIENRDAFDEFGISVFDANGNMRNMADIVSDVEQATAGMSDETRKATLATLGFQERSVAQLIALLGTSDAIRSYETALRSASGTTKDVAGKQLETLTAQFDLLGSKVADARLELGEELAPAFVDVIPDLENLIELASAVAISFGPALAQGVEIAIDTIEALIETGIRATGVLNALPGVEIDIGDVSGAARFVELMGRIREDAIPGADAVEKMFNVTVDLLRTDLGAPSSQIRSFAEALKITDVELLNMINRMAEIEGGAENLPPALDAIRLELERVADTEEGVSEVNRLIARWGPDAEDAAEGTEQLGEESEEAAPKVMQLADALTVAKEEQLGLTSALKAFSDPVFAANTALNRLETAQKKVNDVEAEGKKNTDEWVDAMFDLGAARIDAQHALEELGGGNVIAGLTVIADALGISVERMQELAVQAGILDGTEVSVVIDFEQRFRTSGTPIDDSIAEKIFREDIRIPNVNLPAGSDATKRALGGPVAPGLIHQVGENNQPELLMIPGDRGQVFSNTDSKALMRAMTAAMSTQAAANFTVNAGHADAQQTAQLVSVLASTHKLVGGGLRGGAR